MEAAEKKNLGVRSESASRRLAKSWWIYIFRRYADYGKHTLKVAQALASSRVKHTGGDDEIITLIYRVHVRTGIVTYLIYGLYIQLR